MSGVLTQLPAEPTRDANPARRLAEPVTGRLGLRFAHSALTQRTQLEVTDQQPPLQVIRGFPLASGAMLAHIHNVSGGVLGGDQLHLSVQVERQAQAQLTSTGATRIYRRRLERGSAAQHIAVSVAEGGLLEYVPDPLIPFAGSHYCQTTEIDLAPGAGLFWWEAVAPGRAAQGESFAYECLELRFRLRLAGRPIALDHIKLEPRARPLSSRLRLGPYQHFVNFYICRDEVEAGHWRQLEMRLAQLALELSRPAEVLWGASLLPAAGVLVRGLSLTGRALTAGLLSFWQMAKQDLYGSAALPPRKQG